MYNPNITT